MVDLKLAVDAIANNTNEVKEILSRPIPIFLHATIYVAATIVEQQHGGIQHSLVGGVSSSPSDKRFINVFCLQAEIGIIPGRSWARATHISP